jgi:hypothetical protein
MFVLVTTHKELECSDIIFYYMEHIVFKFELMTVISVVEYLSVHTREPSRAGSRAYIEPSRASLLSSRSDRAEPGSARYSTEPDRAEPSLARLGSFPALASATLPPRHLSTRRVVRVSHIAPLLCLLVHTDARVSIGSCLATMTSSALAILLGSYHAVAMQQWLSLVGTYPRYPLMPPHRHHLTRTR